MAPALDRWLVTISQAHALPQVTSSVTTTVLGEMKIVLLLVLSSLWLGGWLKPGVLGARQHACMLSSLPVLGSEAAKHSFVQINAVLCRGV
jgi:hypothetical protein